MTLYVCLYIIHKLLFYLIRCHMRSVQADLIVELDYIDISEDSVALCPDCADMQAVLAPYSTTILEFKNRLELKSSNFQYNTSLNVKYLQGSNCVCIYDYIL